MWEQRYNALIPMRSEGNTRYYNANQLRRLLNIVSLLNAGHKVSELGSKTDQALHSLMHQHFSKQPVSEPAHEYLISQIIVAAINYDETYFDKMLFSAMLRLGLKESYIKIIYPVLQRLGLLWAENILHPAQEHFVTNLIRRKLLSAIDALPPPVSSTDCWMLFLPENEFHDLGLLFSDFLIRQAGKKVIYLGENMPFESLKAAVAEVNPVRLLTFLVGKNMIEEEKKYIAALRNNFSASKIYIACDKSKLVDIKNSKNLGILRSAGDLEHEIGKISV